GKRPERSDRGTWLAAADAIPTRRRQPGARAASGGLSAVLHRRSGGRRERVGRPQRRAASLAGGIRRQVSRAARRRSTRRRGHGLTVLRGIGSETHAVNHWIGIASPKIKMASTVRILQEQLIKPLRKRQWILDL